VVEAGCAETLPQVFRERLLVTEHDALDDAAAHSVKARGNRARQRMPDAIGDPSETATPADGPPAIGAKHDMDAVSAKPGCLVETALGRAREAHGCDGFDQGALRWRAPDRELQQNCFAEAQPAEASHLCRYPELEARASRGACDR